MEKNKGIKKWSLSVLLGILALSISVSETFYKGEIENRSLASANLDDIEVFDYEGSNCTNVVVAGDEKKIYSVKVVNEDSEGNKIITTNWKYEISEVKCGEAGSETNFKKISLRSKNKHTVTECATCFMNELIVASEEAAQLKNISILVKKLAFESDENQRIAKIQKRVDSCQSKWIKPGRNKRVKKSNKKSNSIVMGSLSKRKRYKKGLVEGNMSRKEKLECRIEKGEDLENSEDQTQYFMEEIYPALENALMNGTPDQVADAIEIIESMDNSLYSGSVRSLLKGLGLYGSYKNKTYSINREYSTQLADIDVSGATDSEKGLRKSELKLWRDQQIMMLSELSQRSFSKELYKYRNEDLILKERSNGVRSMISSWSKKSRAEFTQQLKLEKPEIAVLNKTLRRTDVSMLFKNTTEGNAFIKETISLLKPTADWDYSFSDWCTANKANRDICKDGGFERSRN